jgi:hypothetical protein
MVERVDGKVGRGELPGGRSELNTKTGWSRRHDSTTVTRGISRLGFLHRTLFRRPMTAPPAGRPAMALLTPVERQVSCARRGRGSCEGGAKLRQDKHLSDDAQLESVTW